MSNPLNEPQTDPRDSMTVQQIARNLVDEFPAIPSAIRPIVEREIAGALGHERETRGIPLIDVELLAAALHAERLDRWGSCGSSEAYDDHMTFHVTRAERIVARLASESSTGERTWNKEPFVNRFAGLPVEEGYEQKQQRLRREEEDRL